jgi:hypothetical protein
LSESQQNPLFVESLEEAIAATAMACGGKKAFACELRPDLSDEPDKAHRWLLDALNSDRRTEIHAAHLVRACKIGRQHGCHILKHWLDDAAGYHRSGVAPKKSEHEILAAELQQIASRATEIAGRLGEIERKTVRAVNS